jgi:Co/Zn/Cd efflux system component
MTKGSRYRINAAVCVLVLAYAIYRYVNRPEVPSDLWLMLVAAQGVLGAFGAVWFLMRSRGASA